jgi:hypothetical protein
MDCQFGPHTIVRFASALNTLLSRYNANWLDPSCEAVDALHLSYNKWRDENSWCNPHGFCYHAQLKNCGRAALKPQWSPPDGNERRGTMYLPIWRATRQSYRPALTCSVLGGGMDAVQSANLTSPSLSSGSSSGRVVPPQGSSERHPNHVQRATDQTNNPSPPVTCSQGPLQDSNCGLQHPVGRLDAPLHATCIGNKQPRSKTLESLTATCAKSTSDTYSNAIKSYFEFYEEQGLPPLAATIATMARYIAWIGERGIVKATSQQPYLSAVKGFFAYHGAEPIAQGDLVSKVRRGLAPS